MPQRIRPQSYYGEAQVVKKRPTDEEKKQMTDSAIEENYDDGLNEMEVSDGLRLP